MRVIYKPQNPEQTGAFGWFVDNDTVRVYPGRATEIPDHLWEKIETWATTAQMLAEGELVIA